MAQLKVKQISDFVNAVAAQPVGTATGTAIATAKSEAISQAVVNGDIAYDVKNAASSALVSAKAYADTAEADAISSALSSSIVKANTAEANAISTAVVNGDLAYDVKNAASNALVSAVSQAEAKDVLRAATTATNLTNAISSEVIARNAAIKLTDDKVALLLGGSSDALNTFAEIETFITGLSNADVSQLQALSTAVSNDTVHSTAISTGISVAVVNDGLAQGYADTAEANAISTAIVNGDIAYDFKGTAAGLAGNYATAAQGVKADSALQDASAFDAAGSATTAKSEAITAASSDATTKANAAESNAIADADANFVLDRARIATLESTIIEDNEMFVETFVGAALNYVVSQSIQDNNERLVNAFINGIRVEVASATGLTVVLVDPGYPIDSSDVIVISYQAV